MSTLEPVEFESGVGYAHAGGEPPRNRATLRSTAQDFRVYEQLDVMLSGEGEHLWLDIEKTGYSTPQAAAALAQEFDVPVRDIGYAGMKDRNAITRQWFSVPTPTGAESLQLPQGLVLFASQRHGRKLRRGAHSGNAFTLVLREIQGASQSLDTAFTRIANHGFPNYFGEQRFAGGRNLHLARQLFGGRRLKRVQRGMALSAARSLIFNIVLHERVKSGCWNKLLDGEAVMLDKSNSVFTWPDEPGEQARVRERLAEFDVHPSGPLPGIGDPVCGGAARMLELETCARHRDLIDGLVRLKVKQARRALRVKPEAMNWSWLGADTVEVRFVLPPGVFATTLLRDGVQT